MCGLLVTTILALWASAFNSIQGLAPDRDSGIFLYIGQQLLDGQVLYRDLFDGKGPLLYLLNALGLALGRGSMWGVYLLYIAALCLAFVLVFLGFRRRFGLPAAAAAALYGALLLCAAATFMLGNNADGYIWLTQLAALFLLTRWSPANPRALPYILLGLAGAAAFFIKMTGVGLWIALIAAETLIAFASSGWSVYRQHMLHLAAGAAAGSAAVLGYLAASGALRPFVQIYFSFNAVYGQDVTWHDRARSLVEGIQLIGYLPMACLTGLWALMLLSVVSTWRREEAPQLLVLLAVIWLPVEFAIASYAGHGVRYFGGSLPALVLLYALACFECVRSRPWRRLLGKPGQSPQHALLALLMVGAALGLLPTVYQRVATLGGIVLHHAYYARTKPGAIYPGSCYPLVVDYVRHSTQADDDVLVWGDYSQTTNFLADRRSPTRFVYQPYLYEAAFGDSLVRAFLADLRAHPPALIIDTSPSSSPYLERPSIAAVQGAWSERQPADFGSAWRDVGTYLRDNYHQVSTLPHEPHWVVYRPLEPPSGP
ncbi:MAG: glycosyltransferase family 39 protein [Armatimonadetes bacterium]|nr:glycosyltransferase family 39 protein [Armatimonadota bacterium]